jgi:hypothetical protein
VEVFDTGGIVFSYDELAFLVRKLEERSQGNQAALHGGFGDLSLNYADFVIDPSDPCSHEYRARQLDIYRAIAGRSYALDNEEIPFDIDAAFKLPSPFSTSDRDVIGDHLSTLGFAVSNFDMPKGSRVFEMGAGWGNLALTMAKSGYAVGACDLEARFVELVRRRAAQENVRIDIEREDFLNSRCFSRADEEHWDAILFNACFHHCDDPWHCSISLPIRPPKIRRGFILLGSLSTVITHGPGASTFMPGFAVTRHTAGIHKQ